MLNTHLAASLIPFILSGKKHKIKISTKLAVWKPVTLVSTPNNYKYLLSLPEESVHPCNSVLYHVRLDLVCNICVEPASTGSGVEIINMSAAVRRTFRTSSSAFANSFAEWNVLCAQYFLITSLVSAECGGHWEKNNWRAAGQQTRTPEVYQKYEWQVTTCIRVTNLNVLSFSLACCKSKQRKTLCCPFSSLLSKFPHTWLEPAAVCYAFPSRQTQTEICD